MIGAVERARSVPPGSLIGMAEAISVIAVQKAAPRCARAYHPMAATVDRNSSRCEIGIPAAPNMERKGQ